MKSFRRAFLAATITLPLTLSACTYKEIRPSIAEQTAEKTNVQRFGSMYFEQIAPNVWQHTSYLDVPGFGAVPSNGLIVVDGEQSLLVDTAWTVPQTEQIIAWAQAELDRPIRAAIATHAHSDKMGGMAALHRAGITTYASTLSNDIAPSKDLIPATHNVDFGEDGWALGEAVEALVPLRIYDPGPGHTVDNITVGVAGTDIAFGGCLIKASNAKTLGNLAEADLDHYPAAVRNFAAAFPNAGTIAMSHSKVEDRKAIAQTLKLAKELK